MDLSKFKVNDDLSSSGKEGFRAQYSGAFSMAYNFDQVLLAAEKLE